MSIEISEYGRLSDGSVMHCYTLTNEAGMKALISDYGADLLELWVPDREGKLRNVVLTHADAAAYEENGPAFGAIVGRHANRIAKAEFELNGVTYQLAKNDGPNNLHSKPGSYYQRFWNAEAGEDENGVPRVKAVAKRGMNVRVDLGIVKYHFEQGAGAENFVWA